MRRRIRLAAVVCAVIFSAAASGCGKEIAANGNAASDRADSAEELTGIELSEEAGEELLIEEGELPDEPSASAETDTEPGELLTRTAERLSGEYTLKEKKTYSDAPDDVFEVTYSSDGEHLYIHNSEERAEGFGADNYYIHTENGDLFVEKKLGVYAKADMSDMSPTVSELFKGGLEVTSNRIPENTDDMTVEEYTYMGETYITVYDLYFDKDGELKKYTVCWSVEGEDDLIMTSEIESLEQSFDGAAFDGSELTAGLTDFDALSGEDRLTFCRELCSEYDIANEELYEQGIKSDEFGKIGCLDFVKLIYTYAK